VFKRCGKCGSRVADRRCKCGGEVFSWTYMVDVAAKGQPRDQRKKGGFKTKADAVTAMNAIQKDKSDGTFVEPSRLSAKAYLEQWLTGLTIQRATTRNGYKNAVSHLTRVLDDTVLLQQLTKPQIKVIYQQIANAGRMSKKRMGTELTAKSVHNVHLALRKALADAVDAGLLKANPAERAHQMPTDYGREMLTWTADELRTFLARSEADPHFALWRLAAMTGMRRGELLGLRWSDVDFEHRRVSVRQQLVRAGDKIGFGKPKSKKGIRNIALDPATVEVLRRYRAWQLDKCRMPLGPAYKTDLDLVFARGDGTAHDVDVITHQFKSAVKRTKVKEIRFHDLRHSHASHLLAKGVHPKVVQERLGHSSITITMDRYSHVIPSMDEEAASKVAAIVDGLA
jgi:integrase